MKQIWRFKNSLRVKICIVIIVILAPLNIMLIIMGQHSMRNVLEELLSSYSHELEVYVTRLDAELENVQHQVERLIRKPWANITPGSQGGEMARYNAWKELDEIRNSQDLIDVAYLKIDEDGQIICTRNTEKVSLSDEMKIKSFLLSSEMEIYHPEILKLVNINGENYLMTSVACYGYSFGFLTKIKTLLNNMYVVKNFESEKFYWADDKEQIFSENSNIEIDLKKQLQILEISGRKDEYYVLYKTADQMPFGLVRMISAHEVKMSVPQADRYLGIFSVLSFILVPAMFLAMRHYVLRPMDHLNLGMKEVEKENLGYRLEKEKSSDEFRHMNDVFNHMVERIHTLKIEAYEKDIEKLKIETINLRLQINPHLLINSLNMIYSLAQLKNFQLVSQFTLNLVKYFRYSLKQNDTLVTLASEMDFVKNYLDIQRIRFPDAFTNVYSIEEGLEQVLIPPLMIQNFVENSIKYALKMEDSIEIIIIAVSSGNNVFISIVDTGNGMEKNILEKIRKGEILEDENGLHIGISNLRKRLKLFYGTQADFSMTSAPGEGTQIWIKLPKQYNTAR